MDRFIASLEWTKSQWAAQTSENFTNSVQAVAWEECTGRL